MRRGFRAWPEFRVPVSAGAGERIGMPWQTRLLEDMRVRVRGKMIAESVGLECGRERKRERVRRQRSRGGKSVESVVTSVVPFAASAPTAFRST